MRELAKFLFLFTIAFSIAYGEKPLVLPWLEVKSEASKKVYDFLEEEEAASTLKNISTKYDALGRVQRQLTTFATLPKKKMKVLVTYRDIPPFEGIPYFARFESNGNKFYLNDTLVSEKKFFEKIGSYENKDEFHHHDYISELSAKEIRNLLLGEEKVFIQEIPKTAQASATSSNDFVPYTNILNLSGITANAHSNGYNGSGVVAYFSEFDCPNSSYINTSKFVQHKTNCSGNIGAHATKMINVFHKAAPGAVLHEFNEGYNPDSVLNGVRFDIGFHSEASTSNSLYSYYDESLDNNIINHGTITFVAAGNQLTSSGQYYVSSPGKALNAITVGAVSPKTGLYEYYSRWDDSDIENQKPEVLNYSDFNLLTNGTFVDSYGIVYNGLTDGTSTATAYTAGLMADVLQQHPFFKRHPEMAKALLITGSTKPVSNYYLDEDNNTKAATALPLYQNLAQNTRSAYWNGANSSFFIGDTISFTESEIVAGKRYRIAIAWLIPGTYLNMNRTISQDLDLYVYQNGQIIAKSFSAKNPFEIVDFIAPSSSDLRIKIHRYANSGVGGVKLGYNMWTGN